MAIRLRLKVREVAESRGVNMSQLARKADLGFSTIKRLWKDPYKKTNTELLEKIADALQCSVVDLFEEESATPDP